MEEAADDLDFERYELEALVRRELEEGYLYPLVLDALEGPRGEGEVTPLLRRTLEQRRLESGERGSRLPGAGPGRRPPGPRQSSGTAAMHSISTSAPSARPLPAMADRAASMLFGS